MKAKELIANLEALAMPDAEVVYAATERSAGIIGGGMVEVRSDGQPFVILCDGPLDQVGGF